MSRLSEDELNHCLSQVADLWPVTAQELRGHINRLEREVAVAHVENFKEVWEAYALADDDTLDSHALELKQRLLRITGVEQLRADLADTKGREAKLVLHEAKLVKRITGLEADLAFERAAVREWVETSNCRPQYGGTSRYKGVCWNRRTHRWHADIRRSRLDKKHLGSFENEVDAALAYDSAARQLFGEFARTNFPENEEVIPDEVGN